MSKIICDICGTTYPSSAECCPICGCSNDVAEDLLGAETLCDDIPEENDVINVNPKKKEIFDYDEVNMDDDSDEEEEADFDDEEEEDDAPRHNAFVVVLLTVLIVALLGAAAFIYLRYFLPNMREEAPAPQTQLFRKQELRNLLLSPPFLASRWL